MIFSDPGRLSELSSEPQRIQASYEVVTHRLEPAGLVYLWPISG